MKSWHRFKGWIKWELSRQSSHSGVITLIAWERFIKAILLFLGGAALIFFSTNSGVGDWAQHWQYQLDLNPDQSFWQQLFEHLVVKFGHLSMFKQYAIAICMILYGCLEVIEGVGLLMRRRWAEYLVLIATGAFLPLEIADVIADVTVIRVATLLGNVAIIVYLIYRHRLFLDRRPKAEIIIKCVRHGFSKQNAGEVDVAHFADWAVELAEEGHEQAFEAGLELRPFLTDDDAEVLIYRSPYVRVKQTIWNILKSARLLAEDGSPAIRVYEDLLLREVDHGYGNIAEQQSLRHQHGHMYYRYRDGGENPADCYDRQALFIDSMMRMIERKIAADPNVRRVHVLIGGHGLQIRCLVMRFLHLEVQQFDMMRNPDNCDVVTIAPAHMLDNPQFTSGKWGVEGLRLREAQPTAGASEVAVQATVDEPSAAE